MDYSKYETELTQDIEVWGKRYDEAESLVRRGTEMRLEAQRRLDMLSGALQIVQRMQKEESPNGEHISTARAGQLDQSSIDGELNSLPSAPGANGANS